MSLTSLIDDTKSPVGQFFRERMPLTRQVVSKVNASLKGIPTIRPADSVERSTYSLLGTAIDYRIRYYFPATDFRELVAWRAAAGLSDQPIWETGEPPFDIHLIHLLAAAGDMLLPKEVIESFFNDLETFVVEAAPAGRELDEGEESLLNRYCVVLALFEQCYRAGPSPNSPLFSRDASNVSDLLEIAKPHWVEDLSAQSKTFYGYFSDHLGAAHVLNPTFTGSRDVGGADGDLILETALLDVKATIHSKIVGSWLYQLIGYTLLDYDDQYELTNVDIYLTRQGKLIVWDIQSLIDSLMPNPQTLNELRHDFRELCQTQLTEQ